MAISLTKQIVVKGLELRGAYGRETTLRDWKAGKDFKITGGCYCSIRDKEAMAIDFDVLEFVSRTGKLVFTEVLNSKLPLTGLVSITRLRDNNHV